MLSFLPRDVFDEILDFIESVSEGFSLIFLKLIDLQGCLVLRLTSTALIKYSLTTISNRVIGMINKGFLKINS